MTHHSRGFIALISILIISTVLLIAVVSVAQFGIASRFLLLDLERKTETETLAEACLQIARVAIYNNPLYAVEHRMVTVGVPTSRCLIRSIVPNIPSTGQSTVEVTASSTNATTNLRAVITTMSGNILRREEIPTF